MTSETASRDLAEPLISYIKIWEFEFLLLIFVIISQLSLLSRNHAFICWHDLAVAKIISIQFLNNCFEFWLANRGESVKIGYKNTSSDRCNNECGTFLRHVDIMYLGHRKKLWPTKTNNLVDKRTVEETTLSTKKTVDEKKRYLVEEMTHRNNGSDLMFLKSSGHLKPDNRGLPVTDQYRIIKKSCW